MESNWISVKDRLPEALINVLVCIDYAHIVCVGTYAGTEGFRILHFSGEFFYEKKHEIKVTHWMPLPSPPRL